MGKKRKKFDGCSWWAINSHEDIAQSFRTKAQAKAQVKQWRGGYVALQKGVRWDDGGYTPTTHKAWRN